jgi:CPA2 family monovalent cation:H+ antiporter-2
LPFRDLFAVLFFVAVGALIDPAGLGWLALFLALIVGAKVVPAYLLARLARIGERPLQLAVGLGQVGEFSFVLAALLAAVSAITSQVYVAMIAAVAVSIGASTIVVRLVPVAQTAREAEV